MSTGYPTKRIVRLHVGWPKTGSTSLQRHVLDKVEGHRYLGKAPFEWTKEIFFFDLTYLLSYASKEKFASTQAVLFDALIELEKGLFGGVDPSVPIILSEEAFLSTLLKPSIHQHHGFSTASLEQLIERLRLLEGLWNVSFDILITERDPVELLHAYYAQMFHIFSKIRGLETFRQYVQVGVADLPSKDLGFRYLKHGTVTKAFKDAFGAEKVFVIPMADLFQPGHTRLGLWHPAFTDVESGTAKRENSRSVSKDVKVTHARPIWKRKAPFELGPFLKDVKDMYMARHADHDKLEIMIKIDQTDRSRLGEYLAGAVSED